MHFLAVYPVATIIREHLKSKVAVQILAAFQQDESKSFLHLYVFDANFTERQAQFPKAT